MSFKEIKIKWLVAVLLPVTAIFLFVYSLMPYSDNDIRRSVVSTEHRYAYVIKSNGTPLLYFKGITADSLLEAPSSEKHEVTERSFGCWVNGIALFPSCHGKIATVFTRTDSCVFDTMLVRKVLGDEIVNYDNTLASFGHAEIEIEYYIDTHGDDDEGFDDVLRYRDSLNVRRERIENILAALKKAYHSTDLTVEKNETFHAIYRDAYDREIRKECISVPTYNEHGNFIIQACDSITPDGVKPLNTWNIVPLHPDETKDTVFVMGRHYITGAYTGTAGYDVIPEYITGDTLSTYPRMNITKGSPVFTRGGIFLGIIGGDTIISRKAIRKSM